METIAVALFCVSLIVCVTLDLSVLYALAFGLLIFSLYALMRGYTLRDVFMMCFDGIKTAKNVLITFFLIGVLTAMWRAAGTVPVIISYASRLFVPSLFLLLSFLLNCAVSVLTGTALGTAATMGVICSTMAAAMHIPPMLVGGAVLAGAFFGDRCSPVSTSALLVAELTETDIFDNIKAMMRSAVVPFAVSCALYLVIGIFTPHDPASIDLAALFGQEFSLRWVAVLPAALILVLSLCRVKVKLAMLVSILSALPICLFVQRFSLGELLSFALAGYRAETAEVSAMLNGGGVVSMLKAAAIVSMSAAYTGIFRKTGMLDAIKRTIYRLSERVTPYGATLITSTLASIVACNQTLAVMLTHQLCREVEPDPHTLALDLEDTAVVIAPLVPWSIACAVPLAAASLPISGVLFAFFLYLLPIWGFLRALVNRKRQQ